MCRAPRIRLPKPSCSRLFAALLVLCLAALPGAAQAANPGRVLVLHSYHPGYAWTDSIDAGLREVLQHEVPKAEIRTEYLDAKRYAPESVFPIMRALLAEKYRHFRPDVILATDDSALDFLLDHRDRLFAGAPVVFCGVNDFTEGRLRGQKGYTGVAEQADLPGTLEVMLRLMPRMKTLAVVADATETGRANLRQFHQAAPGLKGRLDIVELSGLSFEQTREGLARLQKNAAVLYLGLLRDADGSTLSVQESLDFVRAATPQPVFGLWDFLVGRGVVGGVVVSGRAQGQAVAEAGVRVLRGEAVENIPVRTKSPNVALFDHKELERQGFDEAALPPGSTVLNTPERLLDEHGGFLMLSGGVILLLLAGVGALLATTRRSLKAEARLAVSEKRFRAFVEKLSVGIMEVDARGAVLYANPAMLQICGAPEAEVTGRSVLEFAEGAEQHQRILAAIAEAGRGDVQSGSRLARFRRLDGSRVEVKVDWMVQRDEKGAHTGFLASVTDLTELRQAEREKEEQHRFASALIEAAPMPIAARDAKGRFVRTNQAYRALFGLGVKDIAGQRGSEAFPPEFAAFIAQKDNELFESRGLQIFETQAPSTLLGLRDVLFTRTVYFDADGKPAGILCLLTDITERKKAEAELRESREKYRAFFENLPIGLAITHAPTFFAEVNPTMEALLRAPREALLAEPGPVPNYQVFDAEGRSVPQHQYPSARAMRSRIPIVSEEYQLERLDGSRIWVEATAAPLPQNSYSAVLALIDITERKRMEAVLHSRLSAVTSPPGQDIELSFTDLFDLADIQRIQDAFAEATGVASVIKAPDGSLLTRPSNFTELCLQIQSTEAGQQSCLDSGKAIIGSSGALCCPACGVLSGGSAVRAGERVIAHWFICQVREPDADLDSYAAQAPALGLRREDFRRWLETVPVMPKERFEAVNHALTLMADQLSELALKIVQQARDIGERERTKQALELAKEAAEDASRAKSDFLANMSHEIRTPLHGVLGMLQLLQITSLDEEQNDYVDKALYSGRSLLGVINDILDFSRIESGRLQVAREEFDPAALARTSVAVFQQQARQKGLEMDLELAPGLPHTLVGDPGKLRQILFNLLGNALKFTEKGGITLRVSALDQPGQRSVLLLEVEDTGIGVSEELQDVIFEPFTQGDQVYTKRFQGTGLGLTIVRRLLENMDGSVMLDSRPGQGTTVCVAVRLGLPQAAAPEPEPEAHEPEPEEQTAAPLTLLLAEDNLINQLAAKCLLQRAGHEVKTAANGREVLATLELGPVDAVLMDIQMPEMDGVAAARAIRNHDGSRFNPDVPIIALSAYAQRSEQQAFLAAGMDEAISKPLELVDILAALDRVLLARKNRRA